MSAPTPGASGADTAAIIVAAGGLFTAVAAAVGKGFTWFWRQRKGRIAQLETALKELRDEFRQMAAECADERVDNVRRTDVLVAVCVVLLEDIEATNTGSRSIARAKHLLGTEFPDLLRRIYPAENFAILDPDMQGLAAQADAALARSGRRRR